LKVDAPTDASTLPIVPTKSLLGVPVSTLGMDASVAFIQSLIESGGQHQVVTADSFGLVLAREDKELADVYGKASLVTADSSGVVWGLSRQGQPAERVSGVDLVDRICGMSAEHGYRIFLLGSSPGVAEEAAEKLRLRHPGCNIVGTRHGFFPTEDSDVVAQEVAALSPDVLFVAMGIPRQEKFIAKTLPITKAKVAMGVGGSLDVFSGRVKRAPAFVQKVKLEWLWRLIQNPKKFEKVSRLPEFVLLVLRGGK
jgi:N-acetylglucosaminyldiphosphoundecaprenol N-acetyl-beta-D-mannosaminyltransferase